MKVLAWLRDYLADTTRGLERFCNRYYGTYSARVIDNRDPQGRGRVRAVCPAINMPDEKDVPGGFWMMPCMNGMGTTADGQTEGIFHPPNEGTNIWVTFEAGDPRCPIYMGGYVTTKQKADTFKSDDIKEIGPSKRGWRTRSGHYLLFDDNGDELQVMIVKGNGNGEPTSQFLSFTKEGHTLLTNKKGSSLYMNAEEDETTIQTLDDKGNVLSLVSLGTDKVLLSTKSGGFISIDGKNIVLNGDDIAVNGKGDFNVNTGKVYLGKGASEPAIRGNKFVMGWGLMHQHTSATPGAPTTPGATPPPILNKELSGKVFIS